MNVQVSSFRYRPNCFHQTMRELRFWAEPAAPADLFSRACVEQFETRPTTRYGYLFAQVFEPYVLTEIAELEGNDPASLAALEEGESPALCALRDGIAGREDLSPVEAVNMAAALVSISRFDLADMMLKAATRRPTDHRDRFEIAMLRFVVDNRRANRERMRRGLLEMRRLIETGPLQAERQIDAASQAVVWHMKAKVLPTNDFDWFVALGKRLAEEGRVKSGTLSSWYRAVAMVPASKGDKHATREMMLAARHAAERSMRTQTNAYGTHFLKTYHESAIKEHMYVTCDHTAAVAEGKALIALDPAWSISHGEVAEVHRHFGAPDAAAEHFEKAANCGPPYVGHHLFRAAQCHEAAGEHEAAMMLYAELLERSPGNPSVIVSGVKLAARTGDPRQEVFVRELDRVRPALGRQHIKYLEA